MDTPERLGRIETLLSCINEKLDDLHEKVNGHLKTDAEEFTNIKVLHSQQMGWIQCSAAIFGAILTIIGYMFAR